MDVTEIITLEEIELNNPIFIEALPGIGHVGKLAADHMIDELGATKFAEIYSPTFPPQVIVKDEGIIENMRNDLYYLRDVGEDNLDLITGDVVVIEIAGGNTVPTAAKIIKKAHENGSKTLGTAGIFGIGNEEIIVKDISEFDDSNPVIEELRKEGIVKDHMVVTTSTFIRDSIPITPYVLDNIANTITKEALKLLIEKNKE